MVQFQVPAPLVLLPQLERARRQVCVDPAGAVGPADHPGLAARAGARVARPHASTRVTRAPRRSRCRAVQPPNAPAPTTTTCRCLLIGTQPFSKGDPPSAVLAAAQDSRKVRRAMRLTLR